MNKRFAVITVLLTVLALWTACKDDVANTGQSVLDSSDAIIVLADTIPLTSSIDSCDAIISQADSFLLGEIETGYGLLRASILTQLACPEGYHYPTEGFSIDSVDSVCLFMYYSSWVGDPKAPVAINAYALDKQTFLYSGTYPTDLDISDYCSRSKSILTNHRIVVASEKTDSIANSAGDYVAMVRMRLSDDFMRSFAAIQSFESQESFNEQFKGLLIEPSFGSSTVLNISDIALGVFYHFGYKKDGKDTVVSDMKAFYANSEVRTVNHLAYSDKKQFIETLQKDSDTYNYIIAPAGVRTRVQFPLADIERRIMTHTPDKRPYVNKAELHVSVENMENEKGRDAWVSPAGYMLLIREGSVDRFFNDRELPSDTCALLCQLTKGTDSNGDDVYYYSYDLSDFITNCLRQEDNDSLLNMVLLPVSVNVTNSSYSGSSAISSVRQEQTLSATKIRSAKNGLRLEIVYSGF